MKIKSLLPCKSFMILASAGDVTAMRAKWHARFANRSVKDIKPKAKIEIKAAADTTEILLYDEIGFWGVTAKDFAAQLADITSPNITVRINSPGGDVFDGMAIYNQLKSHPAKVNTVIDGLAASAASFIALAGDTVTMADNSLMMIHKAWGLGIGNADDMTALAGILAKIDGQLANMYAAKSGKDQAECLAAMKAETWMTADEAKAFGLCDAIANGKDDGDGNDPETPAEEQQEETNNSLSFRVDNMRRRLTLANHEV